MDQHIIERWHEYARDIANETNDYQREMYEECVGIWKAVNFDHCQTVEDVWQACMGVTTVDKQHTMQRIRQEYGNLDMMKVEEAAAWERLQEILTAPGDPADDDEPTADELEEWTGADGE